MTKNFNNGNLRPTEKLLSVLSGSSTLHYDTWTESRAFRGVGRASNKKWLAGIHPSTLLTRTFKRAVDSIVTLSESGEFYREFPKNIKTPDYGDRWGRLANYIEINNRAIANMTFEHCCCGIISTIKLLPAIRRRSIRSRAVWTIPAWDRNMHSGISRGGYITKPPQMKRRSGFLTRR